jgi:GNAT superfamily N-acetyltransferase
MAGSEFEFRLATPSDATAIAALVTQLGYPTAGPEMQGRLARLLSHPEHTMVVAQSAGEVVGMASAEVGHALESDGTYGRITALVVDERWRGRGLGRLLMQRMERWCRERGAHRLTLTSGDHRVDAHKFYEAIGYRSTGRRFVKLL